MTWFEVPIELNPETLVEQVYEEMEARFPGWEPHPGSPEVWLVRAIVYRLVVPLAQLAADVPAEVFDKFGSEIVKVPRIEATPATVTSTWTVNDAAGYTIPAGTQVDIYSAGDTPIGFRVVSEVVIPPGEESTAAGEVLLEAVEAGEDGNGLSENPTLIDALSYVKEIALVGETSGGADEEEPLEYLARLAETMRTLAPRPVIARDVEILARAVAGVDRCAALDNFDPETDDPEDPETWTTEKTTALVPIDEDGAAVAEAVKEALEAEFAGKREANFAFPIIDPTSNGIDVDFTITILDGYDEADVNAAVVAALEDALDPAKWGLPDAAADHVDEKRWINRRTLYYQDLVTVVNNVAGVDVYTKLEVGPEGEAKGTADLSLKGAAPLPAPATIQAV